MLSKVLLLLKLNIFVLTISSLNSIFTLRVLGTDLAGKLGYIMALVAVFPTLHKFLDLMIVRFFVERGLRYQRAILLFVLRLKALILICAIAGMGLWLLFFRDLKTDEALVTSNSLLLLVVFFICFAPLDALNFSLMSVLKAQEKYKQFAVIKALTPLFMFIVLLVCFIAGSSGIISLWCVVGVHILSQVGNLLYSVLLLNRSGWIGQVWHARTFPHAYRFVYHRFFKPYSQPAIPGMTLNYSRQHLATVLVGQVSSFDSVAYFKLFANIFKMIDVMIPKACNILLPTMIKKRDEPLFQKNYFQFMLVYTGLVSAAGVTLMHVYPWILMVLDVPVVPEVLFIVSLFTFNSTIKSAAVTLNYLLSMERDMKHLYITGVLPDLLKLAALVKLLSLGVGGVILGDSFRYVAQVALFSYVVVSKRLLSMWRCSGLIGVLLILVSVIYILFRINTVVL